MRLLRHLKFYLTVLLTAPNHCCYPVGPVTGAALAIAAGGGMMRMAHSPAKRPKLTEDIGR